MLPTYTPVLVPAIFVTGIPADNSQSTIASVHLIRKRRIGLAIFEGLVGNFEQQPLGWIHAGCLLGIYSEKGCIKCSYVLLQKNPCVVLS